MNSDDLYIKLKDLIKLVRQIEKDERQLIEKQTSFAITKRKINAIINSHRNDKMDTLVVLPKNYIPKYQDNSDLNSAFSWKKMIIQTIELHNKFLTVNDIFKFGNIRFPIEMSERRKSVKNISAVLCQLVKEGKISKVKNKLENCKYGITIKHFDSMGKPMEEFL